MQTQNLTPIDSTPLTTLSKDFSKPGSDVFILYGSVLNQNKLTQFQQLAQQHFELEKTWTIAQNTVMRLIGQWNVELQALAHSLELDIALLNFSPKLSQAGLLVMDMDSTAIQIECIDELAKLAGTGELVSAITEQAMRGELDFKQSLRQRVATLKGASEQILQQVREKLPLMPGLVETVQQLKQKGWKVAIASGGFSYFADYLQQQLQLDDVFANQLKIEQGKLTGKVTGEIVDAEYKAKTLQKLAEKYQISEPFTLAVGDGANDLAMLKVAGLGVAFRAKPKVQQQAQVVVNFADLTALLCLLSANDE